MKLTQTRSRLLASSLSLFLLPVAFAGDTDKKFAKMDANNDGQISQTEHTTGARQMFAEMDTNGDGIVTATEMDAFSAKQGDKSRDELSGVEKIRMVDQNADGRLTATEHATSADQKFAKMDTNSDGLLSKEELQAGHKMKKKDKRDS